MLLMRWTWIILWIGTSLLFLSLLSLFLFKENGLLNYGIGLFNSVVLVLSVALNFLLRKSNQVVQAIGWCSTGVIIFLGLAQIVNNSLVILLWNYSLIALTALSGTVLYRTLHSTLFGRIISIALTLFVISTLLIGSVSSIFDKIAMALFILGSLSCLYLVFKAKLNE